MILILKRKQDGSWSYHALIFTFTDRMFFELLEQKQLSHLTDEQKLLTALHFYDLRGGGLEPVLGREPREHVGRAPRRARGLRGGGARRPPPNVRAGQDRARRNIRPLRRLLSQHHNFQPFDFSTKIALENENGFLFCFLAHYQ